MELSITIDQWLNDQQLTKRSRYVYHNALLNFIRWSQVNRLLIENIRRSDIIAYLDFLKTSVRATTAKNYFTIVRSFYKYCELNGQLQDVTKGIRKPRPKHDINRYPLSDEQLTKLYSSLRLDSMVERRNTVIVNIMVKYGLRRIEVVRMNVGDIRTENGHPVMAIQSKGSNYKEDIMALSQDTMDLLSLYMADLKHLNDEAPLFINHSYNGRGNRISLDAITNMVKQKFTAIGITGEKYSAHSLRHTCAILLIKNGLSIHEAQSRMRHRSVETTQRYLTHLNQSVVMSDTSVRLLDELFKIKGLSV